MRSRTEMRRCGCGAILALREGCERCASAARARLHAAGVAFTEVWEISRVEKAINSWHERCDLPPAPPPYDRRDAAVERQEPTLYERTYQGMWEDGSPVYTNACGMPSREPPDPRTTPQTPSLSAAQWQAIGVDFGHGDCTVNGHWERAAGGEMRLVDAQRLPQQHEPPPVGAEVPWEVAGCHMLRNKDAVYESQQDTCRYPHRIDQDVIMYKKEGEWRVSQATPGWHRNFPWVRLA